MKKLNLSILVIALMVLSSCSAIGDVFKAGLVVYAIGFIIVIGVIFWIISLFRGRS